MGWRDVAGVSFLNGIPPEKDHIPPWFQFRPAGKADPHGLSPEELRAFLLETWRHRTFQLEDLYRSCSIGEYSFDFDRKPKFSREEWDIEDLESGQDRKLLNRALLHWSCPEGEPQDLAFSKYSKRALLVGLTKYFRQFDGHSELVWRMLTRKGEWEPETAGAEEARIQRMLVNARKHRMQRET